MNCSTNIPFKLSRMIGLNLEPSLYLVSTFFLNLYLGKVILTFEIDSVVIGQIVCSIEHQFDP